MKRRRILPLFLAVILVISAVPTAFAYEAGEPCTIDLSSFIHDREKREYVEMMVDHHIRTDRDIQNALDGGFSAVFLFDGCSKVKRKSFQLVCSIMCLQKTKKH